MKVSGFSFIRNAVTFDYPIVEAIESILPVCDEFVVAVGKSNDETLQLVRSISSPKIKIIETVWDDSLREGGRVLAVETDKAFRAISPDSDWAFYIQGDEALHEKYLDQTHAAMQRYKDDARVDGFIFDYVHFYGSYDYIADSRHWQRKEIRIVRNRADIYSYKDAMSFRKGNNQKLNVVRLNAAIYHYGWVKTPEAMQRKQRDFQKLWHNDDWVNAHVSQSDDYDFSDVDSLATFTGTHPHVMEHRIERLNWKFKFDRRNAKKESWRRRLLNWVYKTTGWHIGEFKNYRLVGTFRLAGKE